MSLSSSLIFSSLIPSQTGAVMITAAPKLHHIEARQPQGASADPGSTSCDLWLSIENSCTAATPDFLSLAFTQEASCLCYSGTVWQPSVFDHAFQTCLSHLSTASPSQWSAMGGTSLITTPCVKAGNVVSKTTSPSQTNATITTSADTPNTALSSSTIVGNSAACNSWDAIELSCSSAISSFTDLPFSVEASCLCYSSSTYAPRLYDNYLGQCLAYLSTGDPTFYTSLGGDQLPRTPCAEVGNVASGPVAPTSTSAGASFSSSSSSSSGSEPSLTSSQASPSSTSSPALTTTVATTVSSSDVGSLQHTSWPGSSAALFTLLATTMLLLLAIL